MVTVDLFGGLGNQMFQYALSRSLALKNESSLTLRPIDVGAFSKREYALGCFRLAPGVQIKRAGGDRRQASWEKLLAKFGRFLFLGKREVIIREKYFPFDPTILELRGSDIHLYGYWQSEKYFRDIRKTILEDFTFVYPLSQRNQKILHEIKKLNSISVHVRRGDYVIDPKTRELHGDCGSEYYKQAFEIISKKISKPVFYFFSDDVDWVKKNLSASEGKNVYVDWNTGDKSYADMQLMSACRHNILANSSFSWWGAWLNQNKDKIVVAPKNWFKDASMDARDLVPEGWLRI